MTVSNVLLQPERVRLMGDTVAYQGKRPVLMRRKVRLVPHARTAFQVRGMVHLGDAIHALSDGWRDFEDALEQISADLRRCPAHVLNHAAEATVIGWHEGRPRATRLLCQQHDGPRTLQRVDLAEGVYLAPSLGNQQMPSDMTDEQLVKVTLVQQSIAVRHGLNLCVGGDVEVTTIDAGGITVRKIGEYPDRTLMLARMNLANDAEEQDLAAA